MLVTTQGGVAAIGAGRVVSAATASPDGSVLYRTVRTRVTAIEPSTGKERWRGSIGAGQTVSAVSVDGRLVAATPAGRAGRSRTPLEITGPGAAMPRYTEIAGNIEPEAFSTDGESLFVVEYLPPLEPDRYRVRRLDLRTFELHAVTTPDGHLQESMRGTARVRAMAPDGRRLYTLYTLAVPDGEPYAFVHVLDLEAKWAHCVDMPAGAGVREGTTAITVAPDGSTVYVADAHQGAVFSIDARSLRAERTDTIARGPGPVRAAAGADGALYVSNGDRVGTGRRTWTMDGPVSELYASERRLYVTLPGRVAVVDPRTGRILDSIAVPDVDGVGPVPPVDTDRTKIVCAC